MNQQPGFEGKVAAFGSWDVIPFIINEQRSQIPVNAGYEPAKGDSLSERERLLNELQYQIPAPWDGVRLDAFTYHYAIEYLKRKQPRLLYLAFGETDDFAHEGHYDSYLNAAQRNDQFIRQLWEFIQSHEQYRNKTTIIITTDHGRGSKKLKNWVKHGRHIRGSDEVWFAMIGPDTPAMGELKSDNQYYLSQIAGTIADLLGLDFGKTEKKSEALTIGH